LYEKFARKNVDEIDNCTPGANLINIQRLGLWLRLKKASTGMHRGLIKAY